MGRGLGPGSGAVGWCYVCVRCESGFSVWMAGPGICVLCLVDTCQDQLELHRPGVRFAKLELSGR